MLVPTLKFESEAEETIKSHESLKLSVHNGIICIEGDLQLNAHGILIDTYNIRITPTEEYPNKFPLVYEIGGRIIPNIEWHFYRDGHCCLKAPPEEIIICRKGINLLSFIDTIVVPYFFNQKHRETFGFFLKEMPHGHTGIITSLQDIVGSKDKNLVIMAIQFALRRIKVERTEYCFCGSGKKFRQCHKTVIADLALLTDQELNFFLRIVINANSYE
jgi:hypothetical protein